MIYYNMKNILITNSLSSVHKRCGDAENVVNFKQKTYYKTFNYMFVRL